MHPSHNNVYYQMKADMADLLKGTTLRSEIYKTISGSKIASFGHLFKNSAKKAVKYVEYTSEGAETPSEHNKQKLKSNHSMKKLNCSANDSSLSNKKASKEVSKEKGHAQRSERRLKAKSQAENKDKGKNYLLNNSQKPSKEKHKKTNALAAGLVPSANKDQSKLKGQQQRSALSKSKSKLSCKMNLESIIEQSSSQQLITPHHKKKSLLQANCANSEEKTAKKERREPIPEELRKKISKSFTDPQKFIKVVKNEAVTISYRILKRRLIEIEIFVLKSIDELTVHLEKGNLQCQGIQQTYHSLTPNTLLPLFSSVRDVNLLDPYSYPELSIEMRLEGKEEKTQRYLTIPYTFLNLAEEKDSGVSKRSRIRTKLCLEKLPINAKKLRILSQVFKVWSKKQFKGQSQFETHFAIGEHDFRLRLVEEKDTFTLQLQGRGEERLTKLIDFFAKLIC